MLKQWLSFFTKTSLPTLVHQEQSPRTITKDKGTHFYNRVFASLMAKHGVQHGKGLAYHPQSNGQVEISNWEVKSILEKTVNTNRNDWSKRLEDSLCAYRTTYKISIGMSPHWLIFGKPCHLSVKLKHRALWAIRKLNFDFQAMVERRPLHLNELEEI